jgi:hypothetical protein
VKVVATILVSLLLSLGANASQLKAEQHHPKRIKLQHHDRTKLVVAVDAPNGTRLIFTSHIKENGKRLAQVHSVDFTTRTSAPLISKDEESSDSKGLIIGGVNLYATLKAKQTDSKAVRDLQSFVTNAKEGQALLASIPVLYANLEKESAELLAPFGALVMALQLASGINAGIPNLESDYVSPQTRERLLKECEGKRNCFIKGDTFIVRPTGLFDSVSKEAKANRVKVLDVPHRFLPRASSTSNYTKLLSAGKEQSRFSAKNGNGVCDDPGPCFGWCGPGCNNPGQITTPACLAHDYCVCAYGHSACIIDFPTECAACGSLVDAVISFAGEFLEWFLSWFSDESGGDPCDWENPICQGG